MKAEEYRTIILRTCDTILNRIREWDNDIEAGIEIIEKNGIDIDGIQNHYMEFPKESGMLQLEADYKQKVEELATEMESFLNKIEDKKQILLNEKKQLINNESIITNYISPDLKSVFIDRDI